ncbi:peptidoglycan-binding protein [Streptomyces sp. CG1]|uniref:peptidoglycan-binding protein n=1 Tax=Streptomyces sp. CG1 TaxID=1287523 RepID=UPI0034E2D62F
MATPVFAEFDPASDCDCPGCVQGRRVGPRLSSARPAGHPAAACGIVAVAAASAVLGAVAPAAALAPGRPAERRPHVPGDGDTQTPQGPKAPLHGPAGKPARPSTPIPAATRTQIINRAKTWVTAQVPYSMNDFWSDGYRQDCSGYVSMAWGLPGNEWTGSLGSFGVKITKEELQPGDILLYHNPDNPESGSHVVIFGGWTDYTHVNYTVYEQTPPHTRSQPTPYPYWSHTDKYVPYRYKGVTVDTAGAQTADAKPKNTYPGAASFGRGASNAYVTRLGQMLVARGAGSYYAKGPGPTWGEADRQATRAFQLAQGWSGADANGLPGPQTWELLVTGKGKDIAGKGKDIAGKGKDIAGHSRDIAGRGKDVSGRGKNTTGHGKSLASGAAAAAAGAVRAVSHGVSGYPGRNYFRPGAENAYITQLGRQLVKKGFGRFYATAPGPRWGDADRRAVEAFQRAQGWRGGAADGYPGPETWRRLFLDADPDGATDGVTGL